jgi:5-methylthioadenosine/S-adenosylhomocysteine deaminase
MVLNGDRLLSNTDISIVGGVIRKIGEAIDDSGDTEVYSFVDRRILVIPALVNAHTHTGMAFFRGVADDCTFEEWLFKRILPREDLLSAEDVYWGCLFSQMEMARYGIAAFNDMYMYTTEVCQAISDFGMKAAVCRGLVDGDGEKGRLEDNMQTYKKWHRHQGRILVGFGPHAPYSCSDGYLKHIIETAKESDTFIHTHIRESKKEKQLYTIEKLVRLGLFEVPSLIAHCVHMNSDEAALLKGSAAIVLHNPSSNLKLANGTVDLSIFDKQQIPIVLGTDSVASNNALDLWREMLLTALVQKGITGDPETFPAERVFKMATEDGYRYLGFENSGRVETGKNADLAFLEMEGVNYQPENSTENTKLTQLLSNLVYSSSAKDVIGTMVNGQWVYYRKHSGYDNSLRHRYEEYPTIDAKQVLEKVNQTARRISRVYS